MQKRKRSDSTTPGSSKGSSPSARQLEKMLMKKMQREIEKKCMDSVFSINRIDTQTNSNIDVYPINLIDTGTQPWQRIGRTIRHLSLRVTGYASLETVNTSNLMRMIVVWDKQPNAASIPTFNLIMGDVDAVGTFTTALQSHVRPDQVERFKILRDKWIPMNMGNSLAATNANSSFYTFDEYIKLKGLETVYNQSTTGTLADVNSGAIYLIFRARVNDVTNGHVDVNCTARLRYTD